MTSPLDGLLVVSLEQAVAAPLCSCRLSDAGARVIKVERPEGDFARKYDDIVAGNSAYFVWLNRGKESIVLDLKLEQDLELLKRILLKADVLIENLKPGTLCRIGIQVEKLRESNRGLISCSISGFGIEGPFSNRKSYDLLIQAESGLSSLTGSSEEMGRVGVSICDIACGMAAYEAILEAIIFLGRTGEGQHISISIFDVMAEMLAVPLLHYDYGGKAPKRVGLRHPSIAPYGVFQTADAESVLIGIQNEREWERFCKQVLESADMATDLSFSSNVLRVRNRAELDKRIGRVFSVLTSTELQQRLTDSETAFGMLNEMSGLSKHPHLKRILVETAYGSIRIPSPPNWRLEDGTPSGSVPELGADSKFIRKEFESNPKS